MKLKAEDQALIARVVRSVAGAEDVRAIIFGSQARGDARFGSDIDVGVMSVAGMPLPPGLVADLQEALDDSPLVLRAQVVDLSRASSDLRARALSEALPL